jgi:hypothetical protein
MALPAICSGDPTGATWVFTRSNGVWTQQGSKLVGTGTPGNAEQGTSWRAAQRKKNQLV